MSGFRVGISTVLAALIGLSLTGLEQAGAPLAHAATAPLVATHPGACPTDPLASAQTSTVSVDTHPTASGAAAYGAMQYHGRLSLKPKQIVLTFDDGPSVNTLKVLDILDKHCIKANFFFVGWYAQARSDLVKAAAARGHIIGTHTWLHPLSLRRLGHERAERQITQGFVAVQASLADAPDADRARFAPFFRFPGLNDSPYLVRWLGERQIAVFSADFGADDWKRISSAEVERRALKYAEQTNGGILILHEAHDRTTSILDDLLTQLERRGFTFAQMVPTPDARLRAIQAPGALIAQGKMAPVSYKLALELNKDGPFDAPERIELATVATRGAGLANRSVKGAKPSILDNPVLACPQGQPKDGDHAPADKACKSQPQGMTPPK